MEARLIGLLISFLVFIGAITGAYFYGEHRGELLERSIWQGKELQRTAAESLAVATRNKENEAKRLADDKLKEEVMNEKAAEIKAVHAMYDGYVPGGLRINKDRICGKGSTGQTKVNDPLGTDAAASTTVVFPEEIERDLRQLLREADQVTASCRALQTLVKPSQ